MEAALMVIGVNQRTAPVAIRERFRVGESRLSCALYLLARAEGIEEVAVLETCNRTEFILWTSDFTTAATSVLGFLVREHGLRLTEWRYFYRLLGDGALQHVFRVAAGLDSLVLGEPEITGQVKSAWVKAQQAGTCGRILNAVFQKALNVSKPLRNGTSIAAAAVSAPYATGELTREVLGSLEGRKVLSRRFDE